MAVKFIAEIGINHNGSVSNAIDLVHVAKEAGCDAVKFQVRTVDVAVPEAMKSTPRSTPWGVMPYIDYKRRIEFSNEDYSLIDKAARECGIEWSVSVFDRGALERITDQFFLPWIKVPSACITDTDLLDAVASTGRPIIMSTGGSTVAEISNAVTQLGTINWPMKLTLLQCCSIYPHTSKQANLAGINTLRQFGYPVGYSGHENPEATEITLAAVALGAKVIERHVTLSRSMYGSDQKASLEPRELKTLVAKVRSVEEAIENSIREIGDDELTKIKTMRRTSW